MDFATPAKSRWGKYLFCYFVGNKPQEERIHFAVSDDGYNFKALNNNEPVIIQTKGKKCVRDPYIFKGRDDFYYIVGTDMMCEEGWLSNHSLITWKSKDLINWTDETVIDIREFGGSFKTTTRAWAPQVIWDGKKEKYMFYWAHSDEENDVAQMYYAYSDDMQKLTEPKPLYVRPKIQTIDGDIVYNENNGFYYLYFKHDEDQTIAYVKSKNVNGPYDEPCVVVSLAKTGVEGSELYNINGTNQWIMVMDEYGTDRFFMQQTEDFENFKAVNPENYSMELNARHGSICSITDEEYSNLLKFYKYK